jgi:hypothetical protein
VPVSYGSYQLISDYTIYFIPVAASAVVPDSVNGSGGSVSGGGVSGGGVNGGGVGDGGVCGRDDDATGICCGIGIGALTFSTSEISSSSESMTRRLLILCANRNRKCVTYIYTCTIHRIQSFEEMHHWDASIRAARYCTDV